MPRSFLSLVMVCAVSSGALAQDAIGPNAPLSPRKLILACHRDYEKRCTGNENTPVAVQEPCLKQNWSSLSRGCQAALNAIDANSGGNPTDQSAQ